jgi:hypothetical protein
MILLSRAYPLGIQKEGDGRAVRAAKVQAANRWRASLQLAVEDDPLHIAWLNMRSTA